MKKRLLTLLLVIAMLLPCVTAMGITANATVISGEGLLPFEDILPGQWYYESAKFCYMNGIINGQGNTYTFAPNEDLTRASFVVMLARVLRADLSSYTTTRFLDCTVGSWYAASVEWAASEGYVKGIGDGSRFGTSQMLSRQELAVLLTRVFQAKKYELPSTKNVLNDYKDVKDIAGWAKDGVSCMVATKLMGSTKNNEFVFAPKMNVTRSQAAKIMMSFVSGYLHADCEHQFSTPTCVQGSVCSECGMVNELPNGHNCSTLTCKEGGVCLTCGEEIEADPALHKYTKQTCTQPEKCSVCGDVRKPATGHKFTAATCTAGQKCTVCGANGAAALGHTTKFGICTRCKAEVFANEYKRVSYYMATKATPDGKGHYTNYCNCIYENGDFDLGMLYYDAHNASFVMGYTYVWAVDGTFLSIEINIPKSSTSYEYEMNYYDSNEKLLSSSKGKFNPTKVTSSSAPFGVTSHSGKSDYWNAMDELTEDWIIYCTYYTNFILDDLCSSDVSALNFTAYK